MLVVEADDPAYGERLAWEQRALLTRLDDLLGRGLVTTVQVRTRAR